MKQETQKNYGGPMAFEPPRDPFAIAKAAFNNVLRLIGDPERTGGYFIAADLSNGRIWAIIMLGEISSDEKAEGYLLNSEEKVKRLFSRPGDVSSFQSRNPEEGKYAGAIRMNTQIFSFSGLPELWDEALVLEIAIRIGTHLLTKEGYTQIIQASNNPFVTETFAHYPG